MTAPEARYQLARLQDLLRELPTLLAAEGHHGAEPRLLAAEGASLADRLLAARMEAAAREAACASC